jgi:hypothetical protein
MTHDYKRHGTTTLFAALNVLDGAVLGRRSATGTRSSCSTRIGPALGPTTLPSIWPSCEGSR